MSSALFINLPILAFGFTSPALLFGGMALGGIPIIIHLLHKRRYQETYWAAMRFLLDAARKNSRRIRLEQLILLAVRVLILLLAGVALARPYVESLGSLFAAPANVHRIIVIDASFSMGYQPSEFSRFDRARRVARQIAESTNPGDALNLVQIAGSQSRTIIRQPAFQKGSVIDEIDALPLTHERGDLIGTLQELETLLEEAPEIARKEIYLITDCQRESWTAESGGGQANARSLLKRLSEKSKLMMIDLGKPLSANSAVTSLVAEEPFVTIGRPIHLHATLRNFGNTSLERRSIELKVNGRSAEIKTVDLAPGDEKTADFSYTFESAGEYRLEVVLEEDALPLDNHRWLSLPVKDKLNVLLVNGRQSGRVMGNATDHLKLALAPSVNGRPWQGLIEPFVVSEGELAGTDLSRYDCVFLCNVGLVTEREADILTTYVESGGGLVFCLGDQVSADNYNQLLYREGEGILPAELGNRVGNALAPKDAFRFDADSLDHPIVQAFQGNPGTGLQSTLTFEYLRATVPKDKSRIALKFTSGDPVVVEATVGRGRSILITTAPDGNWSTWGSSLRGSSYIPLMNEIVFFAVSGRWSERQVLLGRPLIRAFPTRAAEIPVSVTLPDGSERSIPLAEADDYSRVSFDETRRQGIYELTIGPPLNRSELFAVNVEPRESDLAKVSPDELRKELLAGIDFVYRTNWQEFRHSSESSTSQSGMIAGWLLAAVLSLVFVEQLMAWRFSYGLLLLYAVIAAAFVRQAFNTGPLYGTFLLCVLIAGFVAILKLSRNRTRQAAS